jgi:DNA-binding XRE family transcriptional regulator
MAIRWTPAELEERARADAEIEAGPFRFTDAEIAFGRLFDREVILDRMDSKQKRIAESQRRYYEAHKEEIAEGKRELRDARIALGLTQREAAELLGVDQSTVCRWETIKPPPNWRTMIEKLTSQHKKRRRF